MTNYAKASRAVIVAATDWLKFPTDDPAERGLVERALSEAQTGISRFAERENAAFLGRMFPR